jgi:hypothetical protein
VFGSSFAKNTKKAFKAKGHRHFKIVIESATVPEAKLDVIGVVVILVSLFFRHR